MNMSKEEVAAIMTLAAKIIKHRQDESQETKDNTILRKSEDEHDMTGRPGPGNCECCNG